MSESRSRWSRSTLVALLAVVAVLLIAPVAAAAQKVVIDTSYIGTPGFNKRVQAMAKITIRDGSRLRTVTWDQIYGAPARLTKVAGKPNAIRVKLADENAYRAQLIHVLGEPAIETEGEGEFAGGIQDRWQVVATTPFALEEAGAVVLEVTVVTTSGTYKKTVTLDVHVPFSVTTGLKNVPINERVLLYGKEQAGYNWTFKSKPFASDAVMRAANTQSPYFTPDAPGIYEVQVTDQAAGEPVVLTIYAGTWRGVIEGQEGDGTPIASSSCTNCHNDVLAPDMFTPWAQSGHSRIFTDQINTSDHYGQNCFSCHTVGYNPGAANNGVDEAPDFNAFLASDLLHGASPGNWTMMLEEFPETAKKANIQCENCHGPQVVANDSSPAHGLDPDVVGEPRVSISGELCGTCHGEPLRHSRYQQWQVSGHGNYELALEEGMSNSCAKCHTGNGFLQYVENGKVTGGWTEDEIHPQTCVTCHDPHAVGMTSGSPHPDSPVRIEGDTPMLDSGYKAMGVGRGAICITCHNSRRGLKNDDTFSLADADRAPHGAAESDILMGQNAYLVNVGVRGRHSLIENTCVTCHMEQTPPPPELSYNLGGTNHTFNAKISICGKCHVGADGEHLQEGFHAMIEDLEHAIADKFKSVMADQIAAGNTIDLGGTKLTNVADIKSIEVTESHGRQALSVELKNGKTADHVTINTIMVVPPAPGSPVPIYSVSGEALPKAYWNFLLLENDGSGGAHNPSWVLEILDTSLDALGVAPTRRLTALDLAVGMK